MTEITIVASCVSVVVGYVLNGIMSHVFGGMPEMKKRINTLETDRVAKVEESVKTMQEKCRAHQSNNKLNMLIERIDGLKETVEESKENAKEQHKEFKQMVTRVEDASNAATIQAATALARAEGVSKWITDHERRPHGG